MRLSKISWICTAILAILTIAMFALNGYVLNLTQGHYNIFEILFI